MDSETRWRAAVAEFVARMRALYGSALDRIVLFGSRARKDAREDSDVDLLVVLKQMGAVHGEMHKIDPIASDISLKYDVVLVPFAISIDDFQNGEMPFAAAGRREGVLVE